MSKKKKRKIYVVGGADNYANWMEGVVVHKMEDANLVCFTGGEDVDPRFYRKKAHPTTQSNPARDVREIAEFDQAKRLGLPMIGICRGSQFLCVMSGGILVQHQQHPGQHAINVIDYVTGNDKRITVTSTHHQRQYPGRINHSLLGWCNLSPFSEGESKDDKVGKSGPFIEREVEIAFYPETNCLAIQSHPEFVYPAKEGWEHEYIGYCQLLLNMQMKGEI